MNEENLANWLLAQDSAIALQWLHELVEGSRPLPEDFGWHGLAECAASAALGTRRNAFQADLGWDQVAVLSYRHLIHQEKTSTHLLHNPGRKRDVYMSFQVKLMRVQVRSILDFGPLTGDPARDVQQLVQLFLEEIFVSPQALLEEKKEPKRDRPFREKMEFHWIRQKLGALQPLEEKHLLPENQELAEWFAVWHQILALHEQRTRNRS
jgi:hypothetical protein